MRYDVLGGAVRISRPAGRMPADPREWLQEAAQRCAALPSLWARRVVTRQSLVVALLAGAALGAGLAGQSSRREVMAPTVLVPQVTADAPSVAPANSAPANAAAAGGSLAGLQQPGYLLTSTAAAALADMRATVSDAVALQQLRSQIMAPAVPVGLSGAALSDLVSLVRQAQVASASAQTVAATAAATPTGAPSVLNTQAVTAAEAEVQAAQDALLQATKARDDARSATTAAPAAAPPTMVASVATPITASAAPSARVSVPTAKAADPALIRDARARLGDAQHQLQSLLAAPSPDAVATAQKAVADAVAATPHGPAPEQLEQAKAAMASAQKEYDALRQAATPVAPVRTGAASTSHSTPVTSTERPAPAPLALSNQQLADTQKNLDDAKAALAALQQQANAATNPDNQPAVIAARKALAALTAPPDPAVVANAQAVVNATQRQLDDLLGQGASATAATAAAPAGTGATSIVSSSPVAHAPVAEPAQHLATSATPAPTQAAVPSAPASSPASAATDPVGAAGQRLAQAQQHLRDLIVTPGMPQSTAVSLLGTAAVAAAPSTGAGTAAPFAGVPILAPAAAPLPPIAASSATSAAPSNPPAGSTVTQLTPEIQAAQANLAATGQVSRNDVTAIEIGLRARYVADSVLEAQHLHPSAFAAPLMPSAQRPAAVASARLTWPVTGPITQAFGVPELGVGSPHTGADIGVPIGTPVVAAASGVVSFAGGDPSAGYGYYAIIDHGSGVSTLYGHLALPPLVHQGQFLPQGGLVGLSGSTGFSTGPHVHFEVRLNGAPVDPLRVLPPSSGSH